MLRRIYRCVLGMHPPAFRRRFGDEILAIFDLAPGKFAALRLLLDGFVSLIRQWVWRPEFWVETPMPATRPSSACVPSFLTLDPFRPCSAAIVHGVILSIGLFCLTCFAIRYSWIHVLDIRIPAFQFETSKWIPPNTSRTDFHGRATEPAPQRQVVTPGLFTPSPRPLPIASGAAPDAPARPQFITKAPANSAVQSSAAAQSKTQEIALTSPELEPQAAAAQPLASTGLAAIAEDAKLDAAARHRVIDRAIAYLTKYYVDPEVAQKMAIAIREHENNGDDNGATDGSTFADLLTTQMRDVSHDKYVAMIYSTVTGRENSFAPTVAEVARYRKEMEQNNCTFEKVAILPHNIGYLKFNSFPDASICGPTAAAAMSKLSHADAIIFDLRDNLGGYANMVALIATYLFDRPTHLNDFYDRSENCTEESWTLPPIPGNGLADKPAFVLTSSTTFSAAEGFSYDLKMLKRATLVGETTSGRGHMGAEHRIDDHFTIRVPGTKVVNPISRTNWEGTGVEPDVRVNAADALEAAIGLAEGKLQKK
jgi:hypothetical protein